MRAQLQFALFQEIFDLIVVELLLFKIRDEMALKIEVLRKWACCASGYPTLYPTLYSIECRFLLECVMLRCAEGG